MGFVQGSKWMGYPVMPKEGCTVGCSREVCCSCGEERSLIQSIRATPAIERVGTLDNEIVCYTYIGLRGFAAADIEAVYDYEG